MMSANKSIRYAELEQRLKLETCIADLSSTLVNLPTSDIEGEIMQAQRLFCNLLDLDQVAFWEWFEDLGSFKLTHLYRVDNGPQPREPMLAREYFPWFERQVLGGRTTAVSRMIELPPEAARDREVLGRFGIRSVLALPLSCGGATPFGTLGFIATRAECAWPDLLVKRLQIVAQIIASALARRRSELALRESEERMTRLAARLDAGADLAGLGCYEVNFSKRVGFIDDRCREIIAVSPEQQEDLRFLQFWIDHLHPEDRQRVLDERNKLHDGRIERVNIEYRYLHPTQGEKWIHHVARVAQRSANGTAVRSFGALRDITDRKRVAERQEEDLRFVTLLADLSPRFVNLPASEVDHEIVEAGRRICELLDLDVVAVWQWVDQTGCFVLTAYYSAHAGPGLADQSSALQTFPWYQQQMRRGRIVAVTSLKELPPEATVDRELCRQLGIKSSLSLPLSVAGEPAIGVLGLNTSRAERDWPDELVKRMQLIGQVFANALARKRADQHLRESEELNRSTFEQAAIGMAHVGTDGCWLRVNDRLCSTLGYSRHELLGTDFRDIMHSDNRDVDRDYLHQLLSGDLGSCSMERRLYRKDRSHVWVNLSVSLARTAEGKPRHFVAVVEDITHRKQAEVELQRLRLQLWHSARVAQTGVITASLAHELNQPLTGILSTAQAGLRFMAGGTPDLQEIHAILTSVVHDTKRAAAIIKGLYAMLRHRETQREPIHLAGTTRKLFDLLHSELVGRQVDVRLHVEPDPCVLADEAQIQQVLLNLIMNALDAMQDQPPDERVVDVTITRTDNAEAMVSVYDSGPGISEEQRDKLFDAFWTTKRQGLGIGLAISRSIIESYGGQLWFTNNPDRGATFHFTLPLSRSADES